MNEKTIFLQPNHLSQDMALSERITKELPLIRECLAKHPVECAWIFGSCSRGEELPDSDVDFLIRYAPDSDISLLDIGGLWYDLHELLGRDIDVVEEGCLLPYATETANRDKIQIYERKIEG